MKKKFQDRKISAQAIKIQRLQKQMGNLAERLDGLEKKPAAKKKTTKKKEIN